MSEVAREDAQSVLVVDDDPAIRRLISSTLRRDGYKLTEAQNGREALDAMRQHPQDVVLLDLMMPEMSGWDVLRIRKNDPELLKIPIIVVTATNDPALAEAVTSNICALLPKPFDLSTLHALVRSCLEHRHDEQGRHMSEIA